MPQTIKRCMFPNGWFEQLHLLAKMPNNRYLWRRLQPAYKRARNKTKKSKNGQISVQKVERCQHVGETANRVPPQIRLGSVPVAPLRCEVSEEPGGVTESAGGATGTIRGALRWLEMPREQILRYTKTHTSAHTYRDTGVIIGGATSSSW